MRLEAARPWPVDLWLAFWSQVYKAQLGIKLDMSAIRIPKQKPGFNWFVVVAAGFTSESVRAHMAKLFTSFTSHLRFNPELEIASVRKTEETYAVWCRDCVEVDGEFEGKSADDLMSEGVNVMTLEERGLLEIMFYLRTGEHLDGAGSATLCAGTRRSDGYVPAMYWDSVLKGGMVRVRWAPSHVCSKFFRARAIIPA